MKTRVVNLKAGEVLEVRVEGVAHVFLMRSQDPEWLNIKMDPRELGIDHSARAKDEITEALAV